MVLEYVVRSKSNYIEHYLSIVGLNPLPPEISLCSLVVSYNAFSLEKLIHQSYFFLYGPESCSTVIFSGTLYTDLHIHKFDIQTWSWQSHEGNRHQGHSLLRDTHLEKKQTGLHEVMM